MTDMTSLISFALFYFAPLLLSYFLGNDKYQQNWVNSTTWISLPNTFSVYNFCLPTDEFTPVKSKGLDEMNRILQYYIE